MRTRLVIYGVLMGLVLGVEAGERPNILFIYTDDHSHRTVSCYPEAYDWVETPNIDALAASGVRFAQAYTGTWCMPSRATLLTGHLSYGVESMRMEGPYPGSEYDPEQCRFWPSVFREEGYQTAQIGKWHTGTDTGYGRDWDYQMVWNRPRHPKNAGNYYKDQLIEVNGGEAEMVSGYSTDNYTDWAVEYLLGEKGREEGKPWYLWLCYGAVHGPFTPADRHLDAYAGIEVPAPTDIFAPREGKPAYVRGQDRWVKGSDGQPRSKPKKRATGELLEGKSLTDSVRQYHQGVLALDEAVGRLVETLKETGQYENTLIVFTADQGFAWGQHGFQSKLAPYDATIRNPFIVSMPSRLPVGEVCAEPVGGQDLVPTFFSFAEIGLPWEMHGHDLTALLDDPTGATRERPLLMALTGRSYGSDCDEVPSGGAKLMRGSGVPWWVSLHDGRYKYIRTLVEGEIEELYDLEADAAELQNLALNPEYASRLESMRAATILELKRTGCGFAERMPPVAKELP
jgi:arylsulfatase A-like enzyme